MYNMSYIKDFEESYYLEYLNNPKKLDTIREYYLNQYTDDSNAEYLAFKESLDHYVLYKLSTDKNFINSQYYKNYLDYIITLSTKKVLKTNTGTIMYPEITSNIVLFSKFIKESLSKYYSQTTQESFKKQYQKNMSILKEIHYKLVKNEKLSEEEINIYADYLYSSRDFTNKKGDVFVEYILNNAIKYNIKSTPAIIGAITSFCPYEYELDKEVKNSRFFVAEKDGSSSLSIAHSSKKHKYCVFQKKLIDNTSLTDCASILKNRTSKENDIYWLLYVCFHELTHQYQKNEVKRGRFSSAAISKTINIVLEKYMPVAQYQSGNKSKKATDYNVNHDSDETEIQADEEGWRHIRKFIKSHLKDEMRYRNIGDIKNVSLWMTARKNEDNASNRRTFTMKIDALTALKNHQQNKTNNPGIMYYAYYDLMNLEKIMKEHPNERYNFPVLEKLFDTNGNLNIRYIITHDLSVNDTPDWMSRNDLNNAGLEVLSYAFKMKWSEIKNLIDSKTLSDQEIKQVKKNLINTTHDYILKYRKFNMVTDKGTDFSQYEETTTRIDLNDQTNIHNMNRYLFLDLVSGIKKIAFIEKITKIKGTDIEKDYLPWITEMYNNLPKSIKQDPKIEDGANQINKLFDEEAFNKMIDDTRNQTTSFYQISSK